MSKELTPLEVSKQLKDFVLEFVKNGLDRRFVRGSFDIIETALKRLESLEEELGTALDLYECQTIKEWVACMKNKLKALEIIKQKAKIVDYNPTEYPSLVIFQGFKIDNKEEYEILKEVLL